MEKYEKVWKSMKKYEKVWKSMKEYEKVRKSKKKRLKKYEKVWKSMKYKRNRKGWKNLPFHFPPRSSKILKYTAPGVNEEF